MAIEAQPSIGREFGDGIRQTGMRRGHWAEHRDDRPSIGGATNDVPPDGAVSNPMRDVLLRRTNADSEVAHAG